MKRAISLLLTIGLLLSLGLTAAAAAGMENFKTSRLYTGFTDVPQEAWYHSSVKAAYEYGLVKGATETTYQPNGALTVAEAIVLADRIHMLYETGKDTLQNGTPWYQTYVDYALAEELITGSTFDSYTRPITRGEMADLFSRALPTTEYTVINSIPENCPEDIVGHAFEENIRVLYRAGILTGNDVFGTFTPDQGIIRSEAAAIVSRIVDPSLRRKIELLEKWEYENVTVAMPYGADAAEPDMTTADGGLELLHEQAGIMVYKTKNASGGKAEMTIFEVPQEELGAALAEGLGIASMQGVKTAFGNIRAYRYDFELPADTETKLAMSGSFYVWMQGVDMMTVVVTTVHDGSAAGIEAARPLLADLVNNVRVSGNASSIHLVK